jgi:hypothetical protein
MRMAVPNLVVEWILLGRTSEEVDFKRPEPNIPHTLVGFHRVGKQRVVNTKHIADYSPGVQITCVAREIEKRYRG